MIPKKIYNILEWTIKIIGYALILITVSIIFKNNFYIDNSYYGLWAILASLIIFILNSTIKPILVWLTLPLTALTLGLFYPIVNVIILNIAHIILGNHFKIQGIFTSILIALVISLMNIILNSIINNIIGDKSE